MIRRCHLLLLGGSSPPKSLASCSSPSPPRRFLKHLLGSAAALSPAAADPCSLTLHFLRNSCGLSEPAATKAAARVHLRSTKKAHAVLALFLKLLQRGAIIRADVQRGGAGSAIIDTAFAWGSGAAEFSH